MSFLEITLYAYEKPARSAYRIAGLFGARALYHAKRKAIFRSALLLLLASSASYLLLSGAIVSDNRERILLIKEYEAEKKALDAARASLIAGDSSITIDYLSGLGYKETKNLNVIKRTTNVAEASVYSYQ